MYLASGVFFYVVFNFRRLAISAACFLVVFDHFRICKICRSSACHREKLYSPPRTLTTDNKSPALFLKNPLCTGDLLPARKIFIERPDMVSKGLSSPHIKCQVPRIGFSPLPKIFEYLPP